METMVHCSQGEAIRHFENISYATPPHRSRTIGYCHWLLLVTDQLSATQRKSCIVTRKRLCANNLCLRMDVVTGNNNTRTKPAATNRNEHNIKVVSAENLFTERRV